MATTIQPLLHPRNKLTTLCLFTSLILLNCFCSSFAKDDQVPESHYPVPETNPAKLLILLIDGFRWDYYDRQKQHLAGFRQLLLDGVQAEYVDPIFPSLSFPSWTTLVTGVYPAYHNILGNYMLQLEDNDSPEMVFQLKDNSTKLPFWWQSAEPLWITATKAGLKTFLTNFASCDVPYQGWMPTECDGYSYQDVNLRLMENLNKALNRFKQGYSLAMIYDDSIDHAGHAFGPDSNELRLAVSRIDAVLRRFFVNLKVSGLQDKVTVIITSDHGMTSIKRESGVEYISLKKYVNSDDVYKVVDYGAVVSIAAAPGKLEVLYEQLSTMPGVDVYKKQDIPESYHYKESRLVHDILLVARPGYFITGLQNDKQIPNDSKATAIEPYSAAHGYYNCTDMRTIFFARGPGFKRGVVHPPIRLEDQYQIFTKILNIKPLSHNGTWENVANMFVQ